MKINFIKFNFNNFLFLFNAFFTKYSFSRITVEKKLGSIIAKEAIIDSGTTLIYGPADKVFSLYQLIGVTPDKDGMAKVDCKEAHHLPNIFFKVGKHKFLFEPQYYVLRVSTKYT